MDDGGYIWQTKTKWLPGQDSFTLTTDSEAAPSLADTKWWKLEGWTSLYCTPNSIGQGKWGKGLSCDN